MIRFLGSSPRLESVAIAGMFLVTGALCAGTNTWTGSPVPADREAILVASHPSNPDVVYAVFHPDLYRSNDGGRSWTRIRSFVYVLSLLVHPASPDTLYVSASESDVAGLWKSSDGGETWMRTALPNLPFSLAGDPHNASTVFAGVGDQVYKTTDGGETWSAGIRLEGAVASLVVDPTSSDVVYAGGDYDYYYYPFAGFAGSRDGGATWRIFEVGNIDKVSAIAIDPTSPSTLYLGLEAQGQSWLRGLLRTEDGGETFSEAQAGLPTGANVSSLVLDPVQPSTLYAGTDSGVFRSRDSGSSWLPFGQTLAGLPIASLAISHDGGRLHAAVPFGVFDLDLAAGPIDIASGTAGGSRILRWGSDRLSVQTLDATGGWAVTPPEDPSSTWTAVAIAGAADGLARVLWQNGDGRSSLEIVGPDGRLSAAVYDRSGDRLPTDVSVGSDGKARLLWTDTRGAMYLTVVEPGGGLSFGHAYGPTPSWAAVALADAPDGRTWVLWRCLDGRTAVSIHEGGFLTSTFRFSASPDFTAEDIAVGSDGRARILATSVAGEMRIWTVDAGGSRSIGSTHESAGLLPRRIAAGADGITRVLWTDAAEHGAVWLLDGEGTVVSTDDIPAPPGSVAGDWFGTFDSVDVPDCDSAVPASATFTQQGSAVDGDLNAEERGCGATGVAFYGTLDANQIQGPIMGGTSRYHFKAGSTATGVLLGTTLKPPKSTLLGRGPPTFRTAMPPRPS